jgi:hypothetical protein
MHVVHLAERLADSGDAAFLATRILIPAEDLDDLAAIQRGFRSWNSRLNSECRLGYTRAAGRVKTRSKGKSYKRVTKIGTIACGGKRYTV